MIAFYMFLRTAVGMPVVRSLLGGARTMTTQPPDPGEERTQPGDVTPPDPSPPAAPPPMPSSAEYPPTAGDPLVTPPPAGEQQPPADENPSPAGEPPTAAEPLPAAGGPPTAAEPMPAAGEPPTAGEPMPPAGEYPPMAGEQPPMPPPPHEYPPMPPPPREYPPMAPPPVAAYGYPQPAYGAVPAGMYYDQESGLMLPQGTQLATIGRRVGAFFLGIGLAIITLGIGYIIWGLIVWANGQTPALQVLGMRCWRPETGRVAGWWWMALREIVGHIAEQALNLITYLVSFILMVVTRERKSLHDFIAGTVVLHDPNKVLPSWPPLP